MKTITLAALALVGAVFAATSASAAPFNPGVTSIAPDELSSVIQVGNRDNWQGKHRRGKHWRGNRWRGDDDNNFSFGFGFPLVAYGLGNNYNNNDYYNAPECTGRWHRHANGRLHCHGRLIY